MSAFIDLNGVPATANRRLLTDVERIEIVKGPQSALYGRAAFAGAFNYIGGQTRNGLAQIDLATGAAGTGAPLACVIAVHAGTRCAGVVLRSLGPLQKGDNHACVRMAARRGLGGPVRGSDAILVQAAYSAIPDEHNAVASGCCRRGVVICRMVGQVDLVETVDAHRVDFLVAIPFRGEGDPIPIRESVR